MNWDEDPKTQWEKSLLNTIYYIVAMKDYEKLEFRTRPHEYEGAGMEMEIVIK